MTSLQVGKNRCCSEEQKMGNITLTHLKKFIKYKKFYKYLSTLPPSILFQLQKEAKAKEAKLAAESEAKDKDDSVDIPLVPLRCR